MFIFVSCSSFTKNNILCMTSIGGASLIASTKIMLVNAQSRLVVYENSSNVSVETITVINVMR